MPELRVEQKSIADLLSDDDIEFLIPDYQRPYAWNEEQCLTLWDDIFSFSFPNSNHENFNKNDRYFLGTIVTFSNDEGKSEVIDGQQRLTTLMLLLRAFYGKFAKMQDKESEQIRSLIEKCIWKTSDEFGSIDNTTLKIQSEVATDSEKDEFLDILRTGVAKDKSKSQYASNYLFFQNKIDSFLQEYAGYFLYLPARILKNCILFPIKADSQDTALRIFSTLNDRGLPLSDADIFKAQFYKFYNESNKKDDFITEWKDLEEISNSIFQSRNCTPMDELFIRYMYYLRAKEGNRSSTTDALRKFYERDKYKYFRQSGTMEELKSLSQFWERVFQQDCSFLGDVENEDILANDIKKKLYTLYWSPNSMWQHITSVYFLANKNSDGTLVESDKFLRFLDKITAFIFAYAVTNPGVNALRTPVYDEMVNIVNGKEITFDNFKIKEDTAKTTFKNYLFTNQRNITRSIITWYAFTFPNQELLDIKHIYHIEHIYSKRRHGDGELKMESNIDALGNKILLESQINIRASDYRFEDKKKIYSEGRRGKFKDKSKIAEIENLIARQKFEEDDLVSRNKDILDKFFSFLREQDLLE